MTTDNRRYLTTAELAELLRVTTTTVLRRTAKGQLPKRVGAPGTHGLYRWADVKRFIEREQKGGTDGDERDTEVAR